MSNTEAQTPQAAAAPPAGHEDVGLTASKQAAVQADATAPVIKPGEKAFTSAAPESVTPQPDIKSLRQELAATRGERDTAAADLRKAASELTSLRANFDCEAADLKKRADQKMWIVRRRLSRLQTGAILGGAAAALVMVVLTGVAIAKARENSRLSNELAVATSQVRRIEALANQSQMSPLPLHSARKVGKALARSRHHPARHLASHRLHSTGKVVKALARNRRGHPLRQPHRAAQGGPQGRSVQAI